MLHQHNKLSLSHLLQIRGIENKLVFTIEEAAIILFAESRDIENYNRGSHAKRKESAGYRRLARMLQSGEVEHFKDGKRKYISRKTLEGLL